MVDYKELLIKYICIVGDAEGVSFIPSSYDLAGPLLTPEEYAALVECNNAERPTPTQGKPE